MYTNILIPTDGSALSEAAAAGGIRLAQALGARVTVVHASPALSDAPLETWAYGDSRSRTRLQAIFEQHGREYVAKIAEAAKKAHVPCTAMCIASDAPHAAILQTAAEHGCDLICMASHGRRGTSALLLGSETLKVLTHSTIPVLVHRANGPASVLARQPPQAEAAGGTPARD